MANTMVHVIPCAPGWYYLTPVDGDTFCREPVVAWRVETDEFDSGMASDAHPVCVNATNGDPETILLCPDGRVLFVADREFASEADALEYLRDRKTTA